MGEYHKILTSGCDSGSTFLKKIPDWRHGLSAILFATAIILAACSEDGEIQDPKVLRVAVLPDETEQRLLARHQPLVEYLARTLGVKHQLIIPDDYDHLGRLFNEEKIDLAYFGGFTFIQANLRSGAQALVMRDIDAKFTSSFLVRSDKPAREIRDMKGKSLAFGSKLSTSGHMMPRYFLKNIGIDPEQFFGEVKYSGAHDKTAEWVRDGIVALGIVNSRVAERMYGSGELSPDEVRILWKTPPYPDYVWAVRKELSDDFKIRVRNAFLSLSTIDPDDQVILKKAFATGFLPASNSDFEDLSEIAHSLGFLGPGS